MQTISRRIDRLGRIVLPMDYRKALGLGAEARIILDFDEDRIIIRSAEATCRLCGLARDVVHPLGICSSCITTIKKSD